MLCRRKYYRRMMYSIGYSVFILLHLCNVNRCASFAVDNAYIHRSESSMSPNRTPSTNHRDDFNYAAEETSTHRNKIRHSRYPKLDDIFKKITNLDSLIPVNIKDPEDDEDEEPEETERETTTVTVKTSTRKIAAVVETNLEIDDNEKNEKQGDIEEEEEEEEEEYDEYDEAEYAGENEELKIFQSLQRLMSLDESKSRKLSEIVDRYMMAADQLNASEKDQAPRQDSPNIEDVEDYDDDWDYQQEYQGSQQATAQEARRPVGASSYGGRYYVTRYQSGGGQRLNHTFKGYDLTEALKHAMRVTREGSCRKPQPRIVSIQSLYPDLSKTYVPHCTILHHCGEDSGCCSSDLHVCAPKTTERVELAFYTAILGRMGNKVEKLEFFNHTECECTPRNSQYMKDDGTTRMPLFRNTPVLFNPASTTNTETEEPMALTKCRCPSEFTPQIREDHQCICDCMSRRKDCMRLKKGKEYFGYVDRRCIQSGQCQKPTCEFGGYMQMGRCPKKLEKN